MDNTKLPENKSKRNTHSSSSSSKKKKNVTQTKKESLSKNTAASKKNNKSQIPIDKNFFEVININIAVEDKKKKPEIKEKGEAFIKDAIMYQDTEATFKIMGMLSVSKILTPDAIKKKKFSSYSSVVLVDYENLFNVNTKNMVDVTNIINTIYLSKKSVLFVFVMTKYHESTNIVKVINEMTDKNIDIIDLYISCDVDTGIQKKMCIDVHKFLEMDDYFLLKLYKYMSHFNIPVEVLSADKYNYYNGSINYLYIDMQEKKSQHMVSNPLTYYKQFITPTYKPKYIESEFDKKDYYEHPLMAPTRARKIRVDGRTVYYADDSIFDREDGIWIIDGQKYLVFPRKQ